MRPAELEQILQAAPVEVGRQREALLGRGGPHRADGREDLGQPEHHAAEKTEQPVARHGLS
ncbi:MAG: hypothetical protein C4300_01770 [Thermus sp.]